VPEAQNFIKQDTENFRKQQLLQQQLLMIKKSREELKKAKGDYKVEKKESQKSVNLTPEEQEFRKKELERKKEDISYKIIQLNERIKNFKDMQSWF